MLILGLSLMTVRQSLRRGLVFENRGCTIGDFLGSGCYGAVREVTYQGSDRALKAIFISAENEKTDLLAAENEIQAHKDLAGKSHVVQMYHSWQGDLAQVREFTDGLSARVRSKTNKAVGGHFVTLELCGDNLRAHLDENENICSQDKMDIFNDVVTGISQMKEVGLSHRDLSLGNIFMINQDNDQVLGGPLYCKVGDLGKTNDMTDEEKRAEELPVLKFPKCDEAEADAIIGFNNDREHFRQRRKCDLISLGNVLQQLLGGPDMSLDLRIPQDSHEMVGHEILKMIYSGEIKSINQLKHLVNMETVCDRQQFWIDVGRFEESDSGSFDFDAM